MLKSKKVSGSSACSKDYYPTGNDHTHGVETEERYEDIDSGEVEELLTDLLPTKTEVVCYVSFDGFEYPGRTHIAQGVMKTINVNKLTSNGRNVKVWFADWFAKLNNKAGGDLKKIETVGKYLFEIGKALGMNMGEGKVEFLLSSREINARAIEYWPLVLDIAQKNKLDRIISCSQTMGVGQNELTAAQIFSPCIQCADIFFLQADICQSGTDQMEVNALAKEYCHHMDVTNKPIFHMLPCLQHGQEMSKSDPQQSIFMEDEEDEVNAKIENAYCPPKIVEGNPCLEYIKCLVFPWFKEFTVERGADNGGNKTFKSFKELVGGYESGELRPSDLKAALSKSLNKILEPVREHFRKDSDAQELQMSVKAILV